MEGGTGMKHYTREEWLNYKKGGSVKNQHIMEQHLHDCAQCKDLFLKLIDDSEMSRASSIIPVGFSSATMQYIMNQQITRKSPGYARKQRRKLLSYYAIAAAITIMLVNQGFFQLVIKEASKAPTAYTEQKLDTSRGFLFDWPKQLTKKSSYLTKIIPKTVNFKEVIR
jgi:predicted anti-sigma-YlaC factor YlaD